MEDAGLNGVGGILRIGAKAEPVAAALVAVILVEEGIGQEGQNAADAFFVFGIVLAVAGLLRGRGKQVAEPRLLLLLGFSAKRVAIPEGETGDGPFGGLDLILKPGLFGGMALNPVTPVTVPLVVVELVVDDLAHQLARWYWLLNLLGLDASNALRQGQNSNRPPQHTHPVTLPTKGPS